VRYLPTVPEELASRRKARDLEFSSRRAEFASAGGHDDGARADALFRALRFINVGNTFALPSLLTENFAGHRGGNQRQLSRFHRGGSRTWLELKLMRDAAAAALPSSGRAGGR